VAVDSAGNLYVADTHNNRVLEYDSPFTTDTVADRVFGQSGNFNSQTCNLGGISASSLCQPFGVAVDSAGNLYVEDDFNRRVLEYDSPLTTDAVADRVFGQPDFTSGSGQPCAPPSASTLCSTRGVALDFAGNVYITDSGRVLEYDSPLTTDTVADRVFGQGGSFTSNT
jgi:NHL repeat